MRRKVTELPRRFVLLTLILIGVVSGVVAVVFHLLIYRARDLLIVNALQSSGPWRTFFVIATPALVAAALAIAMRYAAPSLAGANLARVRAAYAKRVTLLDFRTLAATFLLTPLSLGAGVPLGPEGPTVVLTSGLAVYIARLVGLSRRAVRGMIPVGTAAGIAAVFNTPITGVVFAMEEILGTTSRGVLGGTVVAAVAAAVVHRFMLGTSHALATAPGTWTHVWELGAFAMVGIIAGLLAGSFIPAVEVCRNLFQRKVTSGVVRAAIAGFLIGALGLVAPSMLSVGYEATGFYLHGGGSLQRAALDTTAKTVGFLIALSSGLIGGMFAPALFVGAALGAMIGFGVDAVLGGAMISSAPYAFVGMGAFFAGFLRCPISSVLIVFELTGDYELILPLMLATTLSIAISRKLSPLSLTERQLRAEGVEEEVTDGADFLAELTVGDVMMRDPVAVLDTMTFRDVTEALQSTRHHSYPVVNSERKLIGTLEAETIRDAIREQRLDAPIRQSVTVLPLTLRVDEEISAALRKLEQAGIDRCPVVDRDDVLAGFVAPKDVLAARMKKLNESKRPVRDFDMLGRG